MNFPLNFHHRLPLFHQHPTPQGVKLATDDSPAVREAEAAFGFAVGTLFGIQLRTAFLPNRTL
jgi:hypothetical protein